VTGLETPPTRTRSTVTSADGTTIAYYAVGTGPSVIVVGGALRAGDDYLRFAQELASKGFFVCVIDRRGRGESGPQSPAYNIDREYDDLLAVQAENGATAVFGHSYGGLVALELARRTNVFSRIAVYEPGVSINGSIRVGWLPSYRERLVAGDTRGAFAYMARGAGFAPGFLAKMPFWSARAVLRLGIRQREWQKIEPLLDANLVEHEQVEAMDDGSVDRYRSVTADVLLLGGDKSPSRITTDLFTQLQRVIATARVEMLPGLDHVAPSDKAPTVVAARVADFLTNPTVRRTGPSRLDPS
jgi:pimeloyl-ACP methyl ester carboxylesterase